MTRSLCLRVKLQVAKPPRISCELGSVGELHVAFLTESRTRGHVQRCVTGNPGTLWSG